MEFFSLKSETRVLLNKKKGLEKEDTSQRDQSYLCVQLLTFLDDQAIFLDHCTFTLKE